MGWSESSPVLKLGSIMSVSKREWATHAVRYYSTLDQSLFCSWEINYGISFSPHWCKVVRTPEPGEFLLQKSGILGFGIRNPAKGQVEWEIQYLESGIPCLESRIKDCPDCLTRAGRTFIYVPGKKYPSTTGQNVNACSFGYIWLWASVISWNVFFFAHSWSEDSSHPSTLAKRLKNR